MDVTDADADGAGLRQPRGRRRDLVDSRSQRGHLARPRFGRKVETVIVLIADILFLSFFNVGSGGGARDRVTAMSPSGPGSNPGSDSILSERRAILNIMNV